jgi:hypothetical protein
MAQTVTASSKKIKATMALRGLTMHMIELDTELKVQEVRQS